MKTQSSPRSETIAERATLVAYPWRSTTVKGRGVQRGLAITLVDLEQLTDGGAPRARRNSWVAAPRPRGDNHGWRPPRHGRPGNEANRFMGQALSARRTRLPTDLRPGGTLLAQPPVRLGKGKAPAVRRRPCSRPRTDRPRCGGQRANQSWSSKTTRICAMRCWSCSEVSVVERSVPPMGNRLWASCGGGSSPVSSSSTS